MRRSLATGRSSTFHDAISSTTKPCRSTRSTQLLPLVAADVARARRRARSTSPCPPARPRAAVRPAGGRGTTPRPTASWSSMCSHTSVDITRSTLRSAHRQPRRVAADDVQPALGAEPGADLGELDPGDLPARGRAAPRRCRPARARRRWRGRPARLHQAADERAATGVPPVPLLQRRGAAQLVVVHRGNPSGARPALRLTACHPSRRRSRSPSPYPDRPRRRHAAVHGPGRPPRRPRGSARPSTRSPTTSGRRCSASVTSSGSTLDLPGLRGPPAARGLPGHGQDDAGPRPGQQPVRLARAHPVHPRPAALGHHRRHRLRPGPQPVRVPPRPGLRTSWCWPTRSTVPRPRPRPPSSR